MHPWLRKRYDWKHPHINEEWLSMEWVWHHHRALLFGFVPVVVYMAAASDIHEALDACMGGPIRYIANLLSVSWMLNATLCTVLIYWGVWLARCLKKNRHFSLIRLWGYVYALVFLCYQNPWCYETTIIPGLRYDALLTVFLIAFILVDIEKCFSRNDTLEVDYVKPLFVNAVVDDKRIDPIRQAYAQSVAKQLLNVDTRDEAFSMGLFAAWGTGKTTFLRAMKGVLHPHALCIDFNPWNSQGPEQIVSDFFELLNARLSPYYAPLERKLIRYVRVLLRGNANTWVDRMLEMVGESNTSLEQLKHDVNHELLNLHRKIVIFIDDIDRLDKDELFEVLRLIRNTAKFSNIIFIVALDERYTIEMLKQKGVYDGAVFLEKIFPLVIRLPKIDSFNILENFRKSLRAMVRPKGPVNSMLDRLTPRDEELIRTALPTYRKCKLFARQLAASITFLNTHYGVGMYEMDELLMVELLRFANLSLYTSLACHVETYLECVDAESIATLKYQLKPHLELDGIGKNFLERLFGPTESGGCSIHSIRTYNHFNDYFCLGSSEEYVTEETFNAMLQSSTSPVAKNGIRSTFSVWCTSDRCKKNPYSIYAQFKATLQSQSADIAHWQACMYALLCWIRYEKNAKQCIDLQWNLLQWILSNKFLKSFKSQDAQAFSERSVHLLREHAELPEASSPRFATLFARLYEAALSNEIILSQDQVLGCLKLNVQRALNKKQWDALSVVSKHTNELQLVLRNSLITSGGVTFSVVTDVLVKHFKEHKSHNLKQLKQLIPDDIWSNSQGQQRQTAMTLIQNVFGTLSNAESDYKRFVKECFEQEITKDDKRK